MTTSTQATVKTAIQKVKSVYAELDASRVEELSSLYTSDVAFTDPLNHIRGRDELLDYMRNMYSGVSDCRFHFDDRYEVVHGDVACLAWEMQFRHPRLNGGRTVTVEGISHLELREGRIARHRDWFDLGQMAYEHVPLLGPIIRRLKRKMER